MEVDGWMDGEKVGFGGFGVWMMTEIEDKGSGWN
jgi:hypothetical protein